jgi:hypothetical protein
MPGTIWIVVVAALVAACGGNTPGSGSIDASLDASASAIDAPKGGPDASAAGTVACGTPQQPTTCDLPANACCDFTPGAGTPYCYAVQGGVCEGGQPIRCDGPEDCTPGHACCYDPTGGSACSTTTASCGAGEQVMCHVGDDAPCAPNGICCPVGAGPSGDSPYGTCHVGACPV